MQIKSATIDEVHHVAMHMRGRDFEEFAATSASDDREALANRLAARYGGRPDVLCGLADGVPVCIGGTIETWPGVISLLFFATDEFPRIGRGITRFIRRELFPRYFEAGVHRIQAISLDGYSEVHAWLRALGLEKEAEFPCFGKDRQTFVQFAKVKQCS